MWLRCLALPREYLDEMKRFRRVFGRMFVKREWLAEVRYKRQKPATQKYAGRSERCRQMRWIAEVFCPIGKSAM